MDARSLPLAQALPKLVKEMAEAFPDEIMFLAVYADARKIFISDMLDVFWDEGAERHAFSQAAQLTGMDAVALRGPFSDFFPVYDAPVAQQVHVVVIHSADIDRAHDLADTGQREAIPRTARDIFNFFHEIGHMIVEEGWHESASNHLRECAADAYAMLRYAQVFGTADDALCRFQVVDRSMRFLTGGAADQSDYFTVAALQHVQDLQAAQALNGLSYIETALLAGRIARAYSLLPEKRAWLKEVFAPARILNADPDRVLDFLTALHNIQFLHKADHDIFRIVLTGWTANPLLMDKVFACDKDKKWRNALEALMQRAEQEHIERRFSTVMNAARIF